MTDFDIDSFGDHDKTYSHPDDTGETIPLSSGRSMGGISTWEPNQEQETSFGGKTQSTKLKEVFIKGLYRKLSKTLDQTPEAFHFNDFQFRD